MDNDDEEVENGEEVAYRPTRRMAQNSGRRRPPPTIIQPQGPGIGSQFLQSCLAAGCASILAPIVLAFGFFVFMGYMMNSATSEAESSAPAFPGFMTPGQGGPNLREKVIREGSAGAGTIAIVSVQGTIDGNGSPLEGEGMIAFVSEQLRNAASDSSVKVVLLQIDSPGGGLTASDQLYNEVLKVRAKKKIVLAWAGSMMASGGYYIAVGAEGIMASPTSTVGSIGVMMRHFQVEELMEKIGVKTNPIISGAHKDIGSPFREMTAEEREILQEYISAAHQRFVEIVAKGRNMEVEKVRELATGNIYTPAVALENGLIDKIGYIDDAVAWAEELAKKKNMRIVAYRRILSFGDIFREAGRGAAGVVMETANQETAPKAMAVWGE